MATRIEIPYDRHFTDADVEAIIARASATVNVLDQLGSAYQNLPGYAKIAYDAETTALEQDLASFNALVDQLRPLLIAMDAKCGPLAEKNVGILRTLQGLLQTDAQRALLAQITGPTAQGGGGTPPAPTP